MKIRIKIAVLIIAVTGLNTSAQVIDFDGNIYDTVRIGKQTWLKQNLKCSHYSNGESIKNYYEILSYNNDSSEFITFGRLYNWVIDEYTSVPMAQGFCPSGWHIPDSTEWKVLINYLGGMDVAGGKLKDKILWQEPNTGADNSSQFSALPGGILYPHVETDSVLKFAGFMSSDFSFYRLGDWNYFYKLSYYNSTILKETDDDTYVSVRCIKNINSPVLNVSQDTITLSIANPEAEISITSNVYWNLMGSSLINTDLQYENQYSNNISWYLKNDSKDFKFYLQPLDIYINDLDEMYRENYTIPYGTVSTLTVYGSQGTGNKKIVVKFEEPFLNVINDSIHFNANNQTKHIKIESNTNWNISIPESWISLNILKGKGTVSIDAKADFNSSETIRECILKVTGDGFSEKSIKITQEETSKLISKQQEENFVFSFQNSQLSIQSNLVNEQIKITLLNISGILVFEKYFENSTELNLKNLNKGIYILVLSKGHDILYKRKIPILNN